MRPKSQGLEDLLYTADPHTGISAPNVHVTRNRAGNTAVFARPRWSLALPAPTRPCQLLSFSLNGTMAASLNCLDQKTYTSCPPNESRANGGQAKAQPGSRPWSSSTQRLRGQNRRLSFPVPPCVPNSTAATALPIPMTASPPPGTVVDSERNLREICPSRTPS